MTGGAKAVFLDRDGVINRPIVRDGRPFPPRSAEEFHLLPGVLEGCALLRQAQFLLIVATNQPDVGRGTLACSAVEEIHRKMLKMIPVDTVKVSYDSGREKPPSPFRKPRPGMLLEAAHEYGIDLSRSYMVGDRWRDIDCGNAAGCQTIFIDYGYDEALRTPPHFRVTTFAEAVQRILEQSYT